MEEQAVIEDLLGAKEFDKAMQIIMGCFKAVKNPVDRMKLVGYWIKAKMGRGDRTRMYTPDDTSTSRSFLLLPSHESKIMPRSISKSSTPSVLVR